MPLTQARLIKEADIFDIMFDHMQIRMPEVANMMITDRRSDLYINFKELPINDVKTNCVTKASTGVVFNEESNVLEINSSYQLNVTEFILLDTGFFIFKNNKGWIVSVNDTAFYRRLMGMYRTYEAMSEVK